MGDDVPRSLGFDLTKLGLKVVGGQRGAAIAEFTEARRSERQRKRIEQLAESARDAGLKDEDLLDAVEADDATQELFEGVAAAAQVSRYDAKIRYLGGVLANAVNGSDGARLDTAWLRIRAVEDLEPMHVQLLWLIDNVSRQRGVLPTRSSVARLARERGIDLAAFENGLGLLRRHGLVDEDPHVDLHVEVELEESNNANPDDNLPQALVDGDSDAYVAWTVTELGREVLTALEEAM